MGKCSERSVWNGTTVQWSFKFVLNINLLPILGGLVFSDGISASLHRQFDITLQYKGRAQWWWTSQLEFLHPSFQRCSVQELQTFGCPWTFCLFTGASIKSQGPLAGACLRACLLELDFEFRVFRTGGILWWRGLSWNKYTRISNFWMHVARDRRRLQAQTKRRMPWTKWDSTYRTWDDAVESRDGQM